MLAIFTNRKLTIKHNNDDIPRVYHFHFTALGTKIIVTHIWAYSKSEKPFKYSFKQMITDDFVCLLRRME